MVLHALATSLEPLAHRRNVASLNLFYRYYIGRCSSELAQLVPLPFSRGRSTRYSDRLHLFLVEPVLLLFLFDTSVDIRLPLAAYVEFCISFDIRNFQMPSTATIDLRGI